MIQNESQQIAMCIEKNLEDYQLNKKDFYYVAFYHEKKIRVRTIKLLSVEEINLEGHNSPIDTSVAFDYYYSNISNSFFSANKKQKKMGSVKSISIKAVSRTQEEAQIKLAYSLLKSDKSNAEAMIIAKVKLYEMSLRNKKLTEELLESPEKVLTNPYTSVNNIFINNKDDVSWLEE